jgi:hypothetical protein
LFAATFGASYGEWREEKNTAKNAELSERTQFALIARSVEDICGMQVASFQGTTLHLTDLARNEKGGQVAGEYAKAKGKREKAKMEARQAGNGHWLTVFN